MEYISEDPFSSVINVTPYLAREMLNTSVGNRKTRLWYVDVLARTMKRGEWRVTSQGLGFNKNGELVDGHHRLMACIQANTTISMTITMGLPLDAYEVMDVGMLRTYSDRLACTKSVAEVLRLGCQYVIGTNKPTIDQMSPIINGKFIQTVKDLDSFCGTKKRIFSSTPVRLSACIMILSTNNKEWIFNQYRALVLLDYPNMSPISQSFARQADSLHSNNTRDLLSRGMKTFNIDLSNNSRLQVSQSDVDSSVEYTKSVLIGLME